MYFGHFAVAAAITSKKQDLPVMPLIIGTGVLDLLDGAFIVAGADKVTANLNALPYLFFDLTFIDWDHSLVMAILWSIIWGIICWKIYDKNKEIGLVAFLVTFSHFIVDLPMHNHDMALFPFSETKLGLGLWGELGIGSWVLEVVFMILLLLYANNNYKHSGQSFRSQTLFICLLSLMMSPWLSPMKIVATFQEPYAHLVHGILVFIGFLIPSLVLIWMYKRMNCKKKDTHQN